MYLSRRRLCCYLLAASLLSGLAASLVSTEFGEAASKRKERLIEIELGDSVFLAGLPWGCLYGLNGLNGRKELYCAAGPTKGPDVYRRRKQVVVISAYEPVRHPIFRGMYTFPVK